MSVRKMLGIGYIVYQVFSKNIRLAKFRNALH